MLRDVLGLDDGDRGQKIFFFKNTVQSPYIMFQIK
jgi:hypothetical protein